MSSRRANPTALVDVVQQLACCRELDEVMAVLREATRRLTAADGVTVVLREGDSCFYAEENAIAPLWKGRRFPLQSCISGWCMLNRQAVAIKDIYADERVPADAYRPTFVKSLAMVPIRSEEPIGAIGAYWAKLHQATKAELTVMQALGDSASVAMANIQLIQSLREASQNKDNFLSMLAHELRNPLAPIQNALHLLEVGDTRAADTALQMLRRQVRHLSHIVDDLLEVSRLTRGRVSLRYGAVDLRRLVRESVEDRRTILERSGLTIRLELPERKVWVKADLTRLEQVLHNVLENAAKFTPAGGTITITLTTHEQQAIIGVRDTGVGIEPEMLATVFDVFSQADRSLDRSAGGLGIGLSVAKNLVELHNGTIEAKSEGPGRGAEFIIKLPCQRDVPALAHSDKPDPTTGAKRKILVVEDNRDSAESLRMLLQLHGHEVTVAHNGRQAVAAAGEVKPDVLLCDIGLPDMDGFAVGQAIRQLPGSSTTQLIAITGYAENVDRQRTSAAGFDLHLVKPVAPEKLLDYLSSSDTPEDSPKFEW